MTKRQKGEEKETERQKKKRTSIVKENRGKETGRDYYRILYFLASGRTCSCLDELRKRKNISTADTCRRKKSR